MPTEDHTIMARLLNDARETSMIWAGPNFLQRQLTTLVEARNMPACKIVLKTQNHVMEHSDCENLESYKAV